MNLHRDVPVYKLYGEQQQLLTPDMVHCETIAARSRLHNWQIKPHLHHGLFQMLYLKNGTAHVALDDQSHDLGERHVLLVPQMCIHGFHFSSNAEGNVVTVAYPLVQKISPQISGKVTALTRPHIHVLGDDEDSMRIEFMFGAIDSEYKRNEAHRNHLLECLLGALLALLSRQLSVAEQEPAMQVPRAERHFARFCELVEEGYARHYPVAHYAHRIGITAAHLNVLCRQSVGRSALELIHERLLLEARRNLVYTSMPVSSVSYAMGFPDPAYFTRFFKRHTGLSPKQFRQQAKQALHPEPAPRQQAASHSSAASST